MENEQGLMELNPYDAKKISALGDRKVFLFSFERQWISSAFLLLVFFIVTLKSYGTELRFTYLTTSNGLSNNIVNCIDQDNKGYIWIGTNEGLNRYDGYTDKIFKKKLNNSLSLPDNAVSAIYIDHLHHIWVGTQKGLCLYYPDYENFSNYILDPKRLKVNTSNWVSAMAEDSRNRLYVAVQLGSLFYFDPQKKTFIRIDHDFTSIRDFLIDKQDHFWIGGDNGLYFYDPQSDVVRNYKYCTGKSGKKPFGAIYTLMDDGDTLWIGTLTGKVCLFLKKKHEIKEFPDALNGSLDVNDIYKSTSGKIYISTTNGIYVYDKKSRHTVHYVYNKENPSGLNSYGVRCSFEDRQHNMWFGTVQGGVDLATSGKAFKNYNAYSHDISLDVVNIHAVLQDNKGNLWIGSFDNGINMINFTTGVKRTYFHSNKNPNSLGYGSVYTIFEDDKKNIWVGTYLGYLQRFDPKTNSFVSYPFHPAEGNNSDGKDIRSIIEDDNGNLWMVAQGDGMAKFNPTTGKFKFYHSNINDLKHTLPDDWAFQLLYDHQKYIWIATPSGLSKFNPRTETFENFFNDKNDSTSLCNNIVNVLFEDSNNKLWIGTSFGLDMYDRKNNRFIHFFEKNGLPDNQIKCILESHPGELWISTGHGISRMRYTIDRSTGNVKAKFRNYDQSDNLQDNFYWERSGTKTKNGELVFGGKKGIVMFNPDDIRNNTRKPDVYITGLKLFNKPVAVGDYDSLLKKNISLTKEIILDHKQNFLTFEFVAINYISSNKNQYAYKLVGFDKNWNEVGNSRQATYTNLDPGVYTFRVKASNNDGVWNKKGASLKLIISPPYWSTWWFRSLVAVFLIFILVFYYLLRVSGLKKANTLLEVHVKERTDELSQLNKELTEKNDWISRQNHEILNQSREIFAKNEKISAQNELLEEQKNEIETAYKELTRYHTQLEEIVEERTKELLIAKEKAEESDQLKSSFLSNLSHEIRTPLNSIIGFSNLVFDFDVSESERLHYKSIVDKNSTLLLKLINDIIDLSQIESQHLEINKDVFSISNFFNELNEDVTRDIEAQSERKDHPLKFRIRLDEKLRSVEINTDEIRLKQIFGNLIANAIKFTSKGYIEVGCKKSKDDKFLEFHVKDTGIGIKKEHQKIIFERFRKVEEDKSVLYRGTGLGLSISMHLVHLLGGEIRVESEHGAGSTFFFTIPVNVGSSKIITPKKEAAFEIPLLKEKIILVAEDDFANYDYIEKLLKKTGARIVHAVNGKQTLQLFKENPDISMILMDIKMPEMSGIEALQKLKSMNIEIPVIAQTAYAFTHEIKKIMEAGFDGYISKPINQKELFLLLKKHLEPI